MASKGNLQSSERSRIRFMLVDFEGPSSDLQQLTQTFANAVKVPPPVVVALPMPMHQNGTAPIPAITSRPGDEEPGLFDGLDTGESVPQEVQANTVGGRPQSGAKKRKLRTPNVILELEFNSGAKPFKEYHDEHAPTDHSKRYLVIAQWLKDYRDITEVGADHVYSCYKFLSMSVPNDVLSVFRSLKKQGWVVTGSARGMFKITHIGENQLRPAQE